MQIIIHQPELGWYCIWHVEMVDMAKNTKNKKNLYKLCPSKIIQISIQFLLGLGFGFPNFFIGATAKRQPVFSSSRWIAWAQLSAFKGGTKNMISYAYPPGD